MTQNGYDQPQDQYSCPEYQQAVVYDDAACPVSDSDSTLRLVAFVFNLLVTIALGFLIIPLAWMIPMTVINWGIYKGRRPNTVAFGVCTLIFASTIAGILLLVSTHDE